MQKVIGRNQRWSAPTDFVVCCLLLRGSYQKRKLQERFSRWCESRTQVETLHVIALTFEARSMLLCANDSKCCALKRIVLETWLANNCSVERFYFVVQVVATLDILHLWRPAFAVPVHLHWKRNLKNDEDFQCEAFVGAWNIFLLLKWVEKLQFAEGCVRHFFWQTNVELIDSNHGVGCCMPLRWMTILGRHDIWWKN